MNMAGQYPLTFYDIARSATCLLINLLNNEPLASIHDELSTTLVIRESTGQAPA
jgi:DNA-binding LacI/PurR family transcriptional regulator